MTRLFFISILLFFFSASMTLHGQNAKQIKREVEKQRKENAKAAKRAQKYGKARHLSIQDKATRKRIKRNLRNSNRQNKARPR
jgi:uncharacterized protein YdaU (DUF1376 family)